MPTTLMHCVFHCRRASCRMKPTGLLPGLGLLFACMTLLVRGIGAQMQAKGGAATGDHTNNWAVLVCASRFWFNYRHMANTLGMYRTVKRLGIPDSHIILMLADDVACNARNSYPAKVYANSGRQMDLYGESIEVDYRGYEVTVESFLRLLTGRTAPILPPSKRLLTDASSNVFVYLTGHGGNEFLKFQDNEEISAFDIADAIEQMWEKRRYNKLLFMIDTCEANTMYSKIYSPNVISTGSSQKDESSYAHHADSTIGVSVIDAFTHNILQYLERITKASKATLADFFATYDPIAMKSHPGIETSLSPTPPEEILITDFFGGVANIEILPKEAELPLTQVPLDAEAKPLGHAAIHGSARASQSPRVVALDRTVWLDRGLSTHETPGPAKIKEAAAWILPLVLAFYAAYWVIRSDRTGKLDDETTSADWIYRSEGGAHSVYAYAGKPSVKYTGKLLRVRKSETPAGDDDDVLLATWRKELLPRLLDQKYHPLSSPVDLSADWVAQLEEATRHARPEHRLGSAEVKADTSRTRSALLMEDLVGTGGLLLDERVFVCEIKPKWGFMPRAENVSPPEAAAIKSKHCRYCLHQHMRDMAAEKHHYCPLDLYSGSQSRVSAALRGLWESWVETKGEGNNWRVFVDGTRLSDSNASRLATLFDARDGDPAELSEATLRPILTNTPLWADLKQLQSVLDPLDISSLAEAFKTAQPGAPLFDLSVLGELNITELRNFVEHKVRRPASSWTLREKMLAYTLSATFKDCSVFVRVVFRRRVSGTGFEVVPSKTSVKVIDIDLKSMSKLSKWYQLDEKIWRAWSESGDTSRGPCVE